MDNENNSIRFKVLGDYGPFSRAGKSIGYMVSVGGENFLVDCGSPLFNQIGGKGIESVKGIIITHCHDDHKRWFTDLALFNMYASKLSKKTFVMACEDVLGELKISSAAAMDRSLSMDSSTIVDIPFESYTEVQTLGPNAKYKITEIDNDGSRTFAVTDSDSNPVAPEKAKVIVNANTGRPRMLFMDPDYNEWIEPESFYSFNSEVFYEKANNRYKGKGFTIEAIKAPVWHGIPGIGLRFEYAGNTLLFTSDTVHDTELWKRLYTQKRDIDKSKMDAEFLSASIIYGDINDYIERIWGEQRYKDAIGAFADAVVVQDVSLKNSVVHTDYEKLSNTNLNMERTLLTHSPDFMTSQWALSYSDKSYVVKDDELYEEVEGEKIRLNADIYHKRNGSYFVGYKNDSGAYGVFDHNKILSLHNVSEGIPQDKGEMLFRVDLYEDISGKYFKKIEDPSMFYQQRHDEKIEIVSYTDKGSTGKVVDNIRDTLK